MLVLLAAIPVCSSQRREQRTEMEESDKLYEEKKNISIKLHPHTQNVRKHKLSQVTFP